MTAIFFILILSFALSPISCCDDDDGDSSPADSTDDVISDDECTLLFPDIMISSHQGMMEQGVDIISTDFPGDLYLYWNSLCE